MLLFTLRTFPDMPPPNLPTAPAVSHEVTSVALKHSNLFLIFTLRLSKSVGYALLGRSQDGELGETPSPQRNTGLPRRGVRGVRRTSGEEEGKGEGADKLIFFVPLRELPIFQGRLSRPSSGP